MQLDMHFYATYFLARCAGIPSNDARIIATGAQFVDEATSDLNLFHKNGGYFRGPSTVQNKLDAIKGSYISPENQYSIWVPFHFLPGGAGDTLEERLICGKDSAIVQEVMNQNLTKIKSKSCQFSLELMGVAAHVYMDTFSHYGFSGIGSEHNSIKVGSIRYKNVNDHEEIYKYITGKFERFAEKWKISSWGRALISDITHHLGHGSVATLPDRPYLQWEYEKNNGDRIHRDNPSDYLEGCNKLHKYLCRFSKIYYSTPSTPVKFSKIKKTVKTIIVSKGRKEERCKRWQEAIKSPFFENTQADQNIQFDATSCKFDKQTFDTESKSEDFTTKSLYKYYQATHWHRYLVLQEILPKYGIVID